MSLDLTKLQQTADAAFKNAYEATKSLTRLATDTSPVPIQVYDENGNLQTYEVETIPMQKQKIDDFIAGARGEFITKDIKQFRLGGSQDLFYPVIFRLPWRTPVDIQILRRNVHYDASWYGSCHFWANLISDNCGHGSSFTRLIVNTFKVRQFVARYWNDNSKGAFVVWLRGGCTYDLITSHDIDIDIDSSAKVIGEPDGPCDGEHIYPILDAVDEELQNIIIK